ncbi:hypothetical protein HK44_012005 [Pseudomonas fluorescens HK44]|uniref:DUF3077 domain-containing protein n=1 Tax=Pseudomonas fluorescens HK44 TaxID=1042209 RepID=A0A010SGM1_PSEFL|nr:DUF6124 family protein [Pseudomonas fluorescens]EXF92275.1 hypothetical protein HK44_012005 [Pseudomonas fluorescens HK44]
MDKMIPEKAFNKTTPISDAASAEDLLKDRAAVDRALDYYLAPPLDKSRRPDAQPVNIFTVACDLDTEMLLASASETLASANAIACDLAFDLEDSQRSVVLGIYKMIELSKLLVDKALDQACRVNP